MKSNRHHHREICYSSVEQLPQAKGTVLFDSDSSQVFKDDIDITPQTLSDGTQYMPWGWSAAEGKANGQQGWQVFVEGMEGKLRCEMNFRDALRAIR